MRRKNNIIIGILCGILCIMGAGYALFSTSLNIKGISEVTSLWQVEITKIETSNINGTASNKVEPTFTKDTATFSTLLNSPGDYIYYKVEVTNKGTLAAIATLGNLTCGNNDAINCGAFADSNRNNITENDDLTSRRLIIGPGEKEYYNVWVRYNEEITSQPDSNTASITLTLTYEQSDVGITHYTPDKCYTGKVLVDGTMSITDYDISCGTDVVIPEVIDGYTVTDIASANSSTSNRQGPFLGKGITSVVFPDTIKRIGTYAFYNNNLSNHVVLPRNLITLSGGAFESSHLQSVTLNNQLQSIGWYAFAGNNLTEIDIPTSVTTIGEYAFGMNNLKSVIIPSSIVKLNGGAFAANDFDEENAIIYSQKNGIIDYTTINSYARKAGTIQIPSTVKTISPYAFRTTNLTSVDIPDNVTSIGYKAFELCNLKTVNIGSGIESIGENAFNSNPLEIITINRKEESLAGSPWGASRATINYIGTK